MNSGPCTYLAGHLHLSHAHSPFVLLIIFQVESSVSYFFLGRPHLLILLPMTSSIVLHSSHMLLHLAY